MESGLILFERIRNTAIITINHPPANAWDLKTMEAFGEALERAEKEREVRVLIITGAGDKCFSAGFDVSDAANAAAISTLGRRLWRRLDRFPKPTIAAINGYALGGGLELALCCHFRIMADSPSVTVGLTELNLGIIPGWGGTQRLPRIVGRSKALDMILFSRRIGAREALEIGLVNSICEKERVLSEALQLASALEKRPPIAVRWVLEAMSAGLYEGIDSGLKAEEEGSSAVRVTRDRQEGFKAFIEKREPVFTGE
jgi:enoyl-CoA hydratase/carnithine racemase